MLKKCTIRFKYRKLKSKTKLLLTVEIKISENVIKVYGLNRNGVEEAKHYINCHYYQYYY